ncbi:MAG: hypothetical protein QME32_03990 [Endomicrobiia bacterium]|nr:hypothetical protein [Endomicrobiia bacterium]
MSYADFVSKSLASNAGFKAAVEKIKSLKSGDKVLLFPHDDPDGLTAGAILETLIKSRGASVRTVILPTYELSAKELEENLKGENLVVIADKGTIGYYDDYTSKADILVIDHHPPQSGEINHATVFNPSVKQYTQTSTSHIAHMIATALGVADSKTDYLALVGMKADWAIEPATDFVCEYCKTFYAEALAKYPALVAKVKAAPTMFEVKQRDVTTLLNQIGEFYFVLSGGGFQYYYEPRQNEFAYDVLKASAFAPWKDFDGFRASLSEKLITAAIFEHFRQDWSNLSSLFDYSVELGAKGNQKIYFFIGNDVRWMPMAGSVKLYDFKQRAGGAEIAFIMTNLEPGGGVHFSFRSTGGELHLGKLASETAEALIAKYGNRGVISGGGHPVAAECKTRAAGVPLIDALKIFFDKLDVVIKG